MASVLWNMIEVIQDLTFEGVIKTAAICIALAFLWPIIQSYSKVYDITLINRMTEPCNFATLRAQTGAKHIKGSDDHKLVPNETHHYQVVPSWRGVYGSDTLHIKVERNDKTSVIIPVYNSGDIQRSRLFFIETAGVRESGTAESDVWTWSELHQFGQQGS